MEKYKTINRKGSNRIISPVKKKGKKKKEITINKNKKVDKN